ncbi:hypothetical protein KKB71_02955 [Patescibacteria group bacterium]|nr:hypothetical protein [Patescibacteria group bacterium]MBU2263256.1 hypothetical protein [Patescibacteria group bacterium]
MKRFNREESFKVFDKYWDDLQKEWFKVEVLQDYSAEDDCPSLKEWLAGNKQKSIDLLQQDNEINEWTDISLSKPKVKKIRIHIIEKPFTPYLEWEIEHYKHINIPLGKESVYLVPKEKISHLKLPDGDFSIFDNQRVIKNIYSQERKVIGADIYESGDNIDYFLELKRELVKIAEPLVV